MKEKFDKYELIITPLLLLIIEIILYLSGIIENFLGDRFFDLFLVPSLIGNILGILITFLLDKFWQGIEQSKMMDFLRLPSFVLIFMALIASLMINYNIDLSMMIIGIGLGSMIAIIAISSLIAFYREYIRFNSNEKIRNI
ncbi:MAG: hypothetical protein ACXAC7_11240 [Candidatus Hodarchaeales archaeon]